MTLFTRKADDGRRERMVQCLMATPVDERRFMLMSAFQTGELRLSEADEVLRMVRRLEETGGGPSFALWLAPAETSAAPASARPVPAEPVPTEPVPTDPATVEPSSAATELAATELAATWHADTQRAAAELAAAANPVEPVE